MITLLILAVVAYVIFTISNDGVDTTVTVTKMFIAITRIANQK